MSTDAELIAEWTMARGAMPSSALEYIEGLKRAGDRLADALEAARAGEWLPIESAPRDGRWIDAWRPAPKHGRAQLRVQVRWDEENEGWIWPTDPVDYESENDEWVDEYDFYTSLEFSQWRPLPSPPASASKDDPNV